MANGVFDNVVKNVIKYREKVIDMQKMKYQFQKVHGDTYTDQKLYKGLYHMKNKGYVIALKKNLFYIKHPQQDITDAQIIQKYYWPLVKKHCKDYLSSDRYIGGIKALEINISSYTIPDDILIVNQYKQSTEVVMFTQKITFKTYMTGKKNLFKPFARHTHDVSINGKKFCVAGLELAIAESLYNPSLLSRGYVYELVKKIVRSSAQQLNISVWEDLLKQNKHHSSVNRLYDIAKNINPTFADRIYAIIKRYSYIIG